MQKSQQFGRVDGQKYIIKNMANRRTSKKVASLASKLLKHDLSRKKEKSVAASTLSQRAKSRKK